MGEIEVAGRKFSITTIGYQELISIIFDPGDSGRITFPIYME